MHWQGKSVLFETVALVPVKITFIGGQCDTTLLLVDVLKLRIALGG